ncbi:hypothetical protein AKJ16_DCAP02550 [Drosera capensis]
MPVRDYNTFSFFAGFICCMQGVVECWWCLARDIAYARFVERIEVDLQLREIPLSDYKGQRLQPIKNIP